MVGERTPEDGFVEGFVIVATAGRGLRRRGVDHHDCHVAHGLLCRDDSGRTACAQILDFRYLADSRQRSRGGTSTSGSKRHPLRRPCHHLGDRHLGDNDDVEH